MRIVSTIDRPLADEHVIGVDPPLMPELPGVWRRRINPFTGRSLSDRAMTAEQDARAGIQRLRGQSVTAGIVSGLDLLLEPGAIGAAPGKARLQLLPGSGLAQSGEDIVISSPRSIAIGDLPVRARADIIDAIAAGAPPPPPPGTGAPGGPDTLPGGAFAGLFPALPRRIAKPPLGALTAAAAAAAMPRVAVLVAQPVTATILASARDACSPDPRDDPYDDLQLIDGVRLLLDFWPSEMTARAGGPDYGLPSPGPTQRNRLAYRIFGVERAMLPGEIHPWEAVGMPLALIGFNPDWTLAFVDRASVVRLGGRPNPRTPLVPQSGNPVLWQARVAQFAEQLTSLPDLSPQTLAATFRQLPPVGFLPIDVIELAARRQSFFPAGFGLSLAPFPLEQIDLVTAESAALLPINLDVIDEIELLVPVPERVYEPGLLEIATVDHVFPQAITRAIGDRTNWLIRREQVRRRRDVLIDAASGSGPSWPTANTIASEILPDSEARGPVGCTRVREVTAPAGAEPRGLLLAKAGSSLVVDKGDTIYLWIKITDPSSLTGIQLRLGAGDFSKAVFWGSPDQLPDLVGNPQADVVQAGDLPAANIWTRLDIPADRAWTVLGMPLTGTAANGMMIAQRGGTVQYGPIGKIDAGGFETVWIGDDAPPGSMLNDTATPNAAGWPFVPAGIGAAPDPAEDDFGTAEADGVRSAASVLAFRARWTQDFLSGDFADLNDSGIDGFVKAVDARLKATNDAIDLGFVRARSDIYRVRQYMLGADAASRLVTSPTLADLSVRQESARAKGLDIADFVRNAYATTVQAGPAAPTGAPPPVTGGPRFSTVMLTPNFNLLSATAAVGAATRIATRTAPAFVRAAPAAAAARPGGVFVAAPISSLASQRMTFQQVDSSLSGLAFLRAGQAGTSRGPQIIDVQSSTPLPSAVERTASVAERLTPPPAVEAHAYAIAGKFAALSAIGGLITGGDANQRPQGVALGDLPCPGYRFPALPADPIAAVPPLAPPPRNTVADVVADLAKPASARIYQDVDEMKDTAAGAARHESDYFTSAVSAIDNTIALMRLVEARIDLYNTLVADARAVRDELMGHVADADVRLRTIGVDIEEARQDFAISTALLAEEQARVAALNAKRKAILDANAQVVMFRRPRRTKRTMQVPTAPATAALEASPILACTRDHPAVPEEIHSYVGLMRDAPVQWFPNVHPHLEQINRLGAARAALAAVQQRASLPPRTYISATMNTAMPRYLLAVGSIMTAQRAVNEARRQLALQLDYQAVQAANLANARRVLLERAAMADLIAADHNRAILAKAAAQEIEHIGMAAACLHDSFGEVPAIDRLQWAELLSEFDAPAPLRDLNGLAGWSDLDIGMRKTQQGLVDWLFGRVDPAISGAVTAINELVRICLLMAAHAPVDRLIPTRLVAPAPTRIGGRISVYADSAIARIGMTALIRDRNAQLIAHAVVDDLQDGVAHTRIVRTFGAVATIDATARIELSDLRLTA